MANYYRVSPKFWLWARRVGLTDAQTSLALYLLTCEHRNLEGLYRLPKPYIAADLKWPAKKVEETFAVVLDTGFALYDEEAEMVLIPKALKHQSPSTDKQVQGAIAQLKRIPRTSLWDAFRMACASHCPKLAEAIEIAWPSSSSNSFSSSSSTPPQPPAERGEPGPVEVAPLEKPRNSRAHGTNPRAANERHLAAVADERCALAVAGFAQPCDNDREGWGRLHTALHQSVGDNALLIGYVSDLQLVAVDGDVLVVDAPASTWTWATQRFQQAFTQWAESIGVPARLTSLDEHHGLEAVVA